MYTAPRILSERERSRYDYRIIDFTMGENGRSVNCVFPKPLIVDQEEFRVSCIDIFRWDRPMFILQKRSPILPGNPSICGPPVYA